MFVLVLGHSKTGKSRYAEDLSVRLAKGPLLYFATMIPVGDGEEGAACVDRHRRQRAGLGFTTIEKPLAVSSVTIDKTATVLLEDVSNLLSNNLFCEGVHGTREDVLADLLRLRDACEHLIAVSFRGLEKSEEYDAPTNHYIDELEQLNNQLIHYADHAVLLKNGEPSSLKGGLP